MDAKVRASGRGILAVDAIARIATAGDRAVDTVARTCGVVETVDADAVAGTAGVISIHAIAAVGIGSTISADGIIGAAEIVITGNRGGVRADNKSGNTEIGAVARICVG